MFTFEIRINNSLISHIYGHNEGLAAPEKGCIPSYYNYSYHFYDAETGKIIEGNVKHKRNYGINKLALIILEDVEKNK